VRGQGNECYSISLINFRIQNDFICILTLFKTDHFVEIDYFMNNKLIALLTLILLEIGCIGKHKFTVRLCNEKIYSEIFNVNPAGVDVAYLTDSDNFRVYIGKLDSDHDLLRYSCEGDTIKILKFSQDSTGKMKMVDTRSLSLTNLVKNKIHNSEPLFEFK
jgi:hypothetical protein